MYMDYSLAKELRWAGFPQKETFNQREARMFGRPIPDEIYLPTLEELIEACGDEFLHLTRCTLPQGEWSCDSTLEDLEVVYGSTPSEAVARLYLALNKK